MLVYWIKVATSGGWYTPTGITDHGVGLARAMTASTSITAPYYAWGTCTATTQCSTDIWAQVYVDDHANCNWTTPRISPSRFYIAHRSRAQAVEDDLRHFYEQEQRRQRMQIEGHTAEASAKSLELLLAHLTPAQRESFEKNKFFVIEGGLSKQRYRINATRHMVANIDVLSSSELELVRHRLCGHCDLAEVPLYDQLLAQKMMLEFDEERFLKLANRHAA